MFAISIFVCGIVSLFNHTFAYNSLTILVGVFFALVVIVSVVMEIVWPFLIVLAMEKLANAFSGESEPYSDKPTIKKSSIGSFLQFFRRMGYRKFKWFGHSASHLAKNRNTPNLLWQDDLLLFKSGNAMVRDGKGTKFGKFHFVITENHVMLHQKKGMTCIIRARNDEDYVVRCELTHIAFFMSSKKKPLYSSRPDRCYILPCNGWVVHDIMKKYGFPHCFKVELDND